MPDTLAAPAPGRSPERRTEASEDPERDLWGALALPARRPPPPLNIQLGRAERRARPGAAKIRVSAHRRPLPAHRENRRSWRCPFPLRGRPSKVKRQPAPCSPAGLCRRPLSPELSPGGVGSRQSATCQFAQGPQRPADQQTETEKGRKPDLHGTLGRDGPEGEHADEHGALGPTGADSRRCPGSHPCDHWSIQAQASSTDKRSARTRAHHANLMKARDPSRRIRVSGCLSSERATTEVWRRAVDVAARPACTRARADLRARGGWWSAGASCGDGRPGSATLPWHVDPAGGGR
jgi:hypothetical protein